MFLKAMSLIVFGLVSTSVWAGECPNLNGLYWDVPGDKQMNRVMKIEQHSCDSIHLTFCFVEKNGALVCGLGVGGKLDGSLNCSEYGFCRAYSANAKEIITTLKEAGVSRFPVHGDCKWSQYSFSLDAQGNLIETTPATCPDGFTGNLSRSIEKFR